MKRPAADASPGKKKLEVVWGRNGSIGRPGSHTDSEMNKIATGQAMAFASSPNRVASPEEPKRLKVSPMTIARSPAASRYHWPVPRAASRTVPPMTSNNNSRSPMGYERFTAVPSDDPPVR